MEDKEISIFTAVLKVVNNELQLRDCENVSCFILASANNIARPWKLFRNTGRVNVSKY